MQKKFITNGHNQWKRFRLGIVTTNPDGCRVAENVEWKEILVAVRI
jgi:hypothetical protein